MHVLLYPRVVYIVKHKVALEQLVQVQPREFLNFNPMKRPDQRNVWLLKWQQMSDSGAITQKRYYDYLPRIQSGKIPPELRERFPKEQREQLSLF